MKPGELCILKCRVTVWSSKRVLNLCILGYLDEGSPTIFLREDFGVEHYSEMLTAHGIGWIHSSFLRI